MTPLAKIPTRNLQPEGWGTLSQIETIDAQHTMTKFTRECFHTSFLANEKLEASLKSLCVSPNAARNRDILAVEIPFAVQNGKVSTNGLPSRLLVAAGNNIATFLPWYTLFKLGMVQDHMTTLAEVFNRAASISCLNLSAHISKMSQTYPRRRHAYSLLLSDTAGALVRDPQTLDEEIEDFEDPQSDREELDARLQTYIDRHTAIAVPAWQSQHDRLKVMKSAELGTRIANLAFPLLHPLDKTPVLPEPRLL